MAAAAVPTAAVLARISSPTLSTTPCLSSSCIVSRNFTFSLSITFSATTPRVGSLVRAEATSNNDDPKDSPIISQDDLTYLGKLAAGSVVGAAAIKYGSAVFPEITRPNITEALLIICFPVIVAVLLLLRQSLSK